MMNKDVRKRCPKCNTLFTVEQILNDPEIVPIGMLFDDLTNLQNVYVFNHISDDCHTTFCIPVEYFSVYIDDSNNYDILAGTDNCEHHCLSLSDMSLCHQPCHFAPYRRLLLKMIKDKRTAHRTVTNSGS